MATQKQKYPIKEREHWHHLLDSTVWNEFAFRDDDIVINAYSRSGTTWVQQIVGQLIWMGAEQINLSEVSPWLDCRFPSKAERLEMMEAQPHRRFIKSHLPVDTLVFSPNAKYIYVGRDGRDVLWSLYYYHRNLKKDVIRDIDSVPERAGPALGEAPSSVLDYFREWLRKDGLPWWPYWPHILSWWRIKDLPNVMLLHFSDLKRDMPGEIRRIAAFLDIPIDETKWDSILEHCSFEYMKAHAAQCVPFGGKIYKGGADTFLHKGANGRWRDILTPADIEHYEQTANEKLGADCAFWLSAGILHHIENT